jgi:hypothetical protein
VNGQYGGITGRSELLARRETTPTCGYSGHVQHPLSASGTGTSGERRKAALSGYAQSGDLARAGAAGVDHHLAKLATISKIQEVMAVASGRRNPD